ncbi:MAG: PIN domain-containing protein [Candidatus Bathyarchaeota archaeon]|nr:PIN domain-containing protein [Candidatus Bathyarchaeota archaeon]
MKFKKRIYLDTNLYCRPLDNQKDMRIKSETQAFLEMVNKAENGKITIISSNYVKFEIKQIINPQKRKDVQSFEKTLSKTNITSNKKLTTLAQEFISKCHLNALDALHTASACIGNADYLLTCDDQITDSATCIEKIAQTKGYKIKVRNPIKYIQEKGE